MKKKIVYVAGNPLVKEDSVPLKMLAPLREEFPSIEFRELDPTDTLPEESHLNIIDTVIGIDTVEIITDIDKIVTGKVYSLHDFDLGFNLKLMKKMGMIKSVKIIGVPAHMPEDEAMKNVSRVLKSII